jgi:hypothetical protein
MSICTANRANGLKCKAPAVSGTTVCRVHGGCAPQVRAAAQNRLKMLGMMALGVMEELANLKSEPGIRFQAARDLLNRAKVGEGEAVRVEGDHLAGMAEAELERRLIELGRLEWMSGERPPGYQPRPPRKKKYQ